MPDREEVLRLAKEAGFKIEPGKYSGSYIIEGDGGFSMASLERFAALVAESCAKELEREQMRKDAERYRWIRGRLLGADFDWNETGASALVFEMPKQARVSGDCDKTIDEAMSLSGGGDDENQS